MEAVPSLSISNHSSKLHAGRYGQLSVHKPMGSLGHFGPWVPRPTTAAANRERQHASLSSIRANSRWCSGPQFASINEPKTHSKVIIAWREGAMTDISDMHESALVGDMVCRFINASSLYSWGSLLQMTLHGPASRPAGGCRHARFRRVTVLFGSAAQMAAAADTLCTKYCKNKKRQRRSTLAVSSALGRCMQAPTCMRPTITACAEHVYNVTATGPVKHSFLPLSIRSAANLCPSQGW